MKRCDEVEVRGLTVGIEQLELLACKYRNIYPLKTRRGYLDIEAPSQRASFGISQTAASAVVSLTFLTSSLSVLG